MQLTTAGVFVLFLIGCTGDISKAPKTPDNKSTSDPEAIDVLAFPMHPIIGKPHHVLATSSSIWVSDFSGDPYLHRISRSDEKLQISTGKPGDGPGDFRSVSGILPSFDGSGVWIADATNRRLTLLDSNAEFTGVMINLPVSPRVMKVVRLGPHFAGWTLAANETERIILIDSTGQTVGKASGNLLGTYSLPIRQRLLPSQLMSMCASPNGNRFAVVYGNARKIEIRDSVGLLVGLANVRSGNNGVVARNIRGEAFLVRSTYQYVDCAATNTHVWTLYSGWDKQIAGPESDDRDAHLSRLVEVYDWDGNLVTTFHLKKPVGSIAISPDESTAFGTNSSTGEVLRIDFPANLLEAKR